jgi:N-acetylmuramoyl-L-alanine amidase
MRDPKDAAELTDPAWRQRAARGIADGITAYLEGKT